MVTHFLPDPDKKSIIDRYSSRFREHGIDPKTLNTGKGDKHRIQLDVHASAGQLSGKSVLDIGCGLAFFYRHLRDAGVIVKYTGYDIVDDFVTSNQAQYPQCHFETRDILVDGINSSPDWAFFCQVFNNRYKHADNRKVVEQCLQLAFAACREGVSIDMLSTYVSFREDHLYYFSPEEMFAFAKTLSPYVTLRSDYLPYDFTLTIYKAPRNG